MKKRLLYCGIFVVLGIAFESAIAKPIQPALKNVWSPKSNIEIIKEEARLKFMLFLNMIPDGKEAAYGFSTRSDFNMVQIGEPYRTCYVIEKEKKLFLTDGNEWRVPLLVNGHYVALLTVQLNAGIAEAVDFGATQLAFKLEEFENTYSAQHPEHIIVRNTYLKRDYLCTASSGLALPAPGNNTALDAQSAQLIYQVNTSLPLAVSLARFCSESLAIASSSN